MQTMPGRGLDDLETSLVVSVQEELESGSRKLVSGKECMHKVLHQCQEPPPPLCLPRY